MAAPVLRVTFLPRDMIAIGVFGCRERKSKEFVVAWIAGVLDS
jgi:hypothetical protein